MGSPKKTLLVEQISYNERGLYHLKDELRDLIAKINVEYTRFSEEFENLRTQEDKVSEQTLSTINKLLQDAWKGAMSARGYLQQLDNNFHNTEALFKKIYTTLENRME